MSDSFSVTGRKRSSLPVTEEGIAHIRRSEMFNGRRADKRLMRAGVLSQQNFVLPDQAPGASRVRQ